MVMSPEASLSAVLGMEASCSATRATRRASRLDIRTLFCNTSAAAGPAPLWVTAAATSHSTESALFLMRPSVAASVRSSGPDNPATVTRSSQARAGLGSPALGLNASSFMAFNLTYGCDTERDLTPEKGLQSCYNLVTILLQSVT